MMKLAMKKQKITGHHKHHRFHVFDVVLVLSLAFMFFTMLSFMINSASFMLFGTIVTHVATNDKVVALTFDDGPLPSGTEETLAALKASKVKATFFVIGVEALRHPDQLKAIIASGNEVGNHSYSHKNMAFMSPQDVATEVEKNDSLIRGAGYVGPLYFRTPYNAKFVTLPYYLMSHKRIDVSRDVIPKEGKDRTSDQIVNDIMAQVKPGSIILMHPMYAHTGSSRRAIVPLVERLKKQGYRFLTISELLQYRKV